MKCSVITCKNKVKFRFPSDNVVKEKWLKAIGRPKFVPSRCHGLCVEHFNPTDIMTESYNGGHKLQSMRLKRGALPMKISMKNVNIQENYHESQFILTEEQLLLSPSKLIGQVYREVEETQSSNHKEVCVNADVCTTEYSDQDLSNSHTKLVAKQTLNDTKEKVDDECSNHYIKACLSEVVNDTSLDLSHDTDNDEVIDLTSCDDKNQIQCGIDVYEEEVGGHIRNTETDELTEPPANNEQNIPCDNSEKQKSISTQTFSVQRYTITDFKDKPKSLLHFIGLENYEKFLTVLYSLGPGVYNLKYVRKNVGDLNIADQLFLVLWKLRRYPSDIELAEHFNIVDVAVGNIFITWIIFISKTWSLIDTWPSRELIDFYMPDSFKNYNRTTRLIVDGTEIKTDGSSNPHKKQSTFSHYKNSPTMKTLIGGTPGGLISYFSPAYSGSTSDRQIIERSDVAKKCKKGDTILADKGFLVQDIFAPYGVTIATPTPVVTGSLPHKTVLKDRKLSKRRVHVERFIGLLKTFTILSKKLNHYYTPYTSEIVGVCVMLTNFKENIMKPKK